MLGLACLFLTGCWWSGAAKTPIARLSQGLVEACEEQYGIVIPEDAVFETGAYVDELRESWIVLVFTLPVDTDADAEGRPEAKLSRRLGLDLPGNGAPNADGFMEEYGGRMEYKIEMKDCFNCIYFTETDEQTIRVRFVGWRPEKRFD